MEISEIEDNLISIGEPKLHGEMCRSLCSVYAKVLAVFPELEAARPRSTSGIQTLCALHIALEKTKTILQHCADCSKLYLAITGDSVILKFEKARFALEECLKRVEDIVPQIIACQVADILMELGRIEFSLDPIEKQIGDDIIGLLQHGRDLNQSSSDNELESFHQAVSKLGIISSRAALRERRALKKLLERARVEEDKRKESIIAYLMYLMRKYSKMFRSEFSDDNESQGSTPCSPTIQCDGYAFDRQISKLSSFNFKPNFRRSDLVPVPPEELRCPISLQLMYDPVIVASGQIYERVCIEKWFADGHNTCPKTQQELPHRSLTPNYCVKGLVASWCEHNRLPIPTGAPDSLDLNYWSLLSESDSANSKSLESVSSYKFKGLKVVPLNDIAVAEDSEGNGPETTAQGDSDGHPASGRYHNFLSTLEKDIDLMEKCIVVEQIRHLLKDDEEARIYMGANGFIELLLQFLDTAVTARNEKAQEIGAMAVFNLAVNNNRNKELLMASGVLTILEKMTSGTDSVGPTTALLLNLSCLDEAKPIIGTTEAATRFLISVLNHEPNEQSKLDAIHTLYNISSHPTNIPNLLSAGIIDALQALITNPDSQWPIEKCIAVLIYLTSSKDARDEIISSPNLITKLASTLDVEEPTEQEQAAACLLILCNGNDNCCQMVLQEGVIPSLVSISMNGTIRGKQKAKKLLMLFREQRQRDPSSDPPQAMSESSEKIIYTQDLKQLSKSTSRRKVGKALSFWWKKNKSFSVYQC